MELIEKLRSLDSDSSLGAIQSYVNEMIPARGFSDETLQEVMILLTEEVGELAKEVRKLSRMKIDANASRECAIGGEIADVFLYLLAMCRVLDLDLFELFMEKELKNSTRVWI